MGSSVLMDSLLKEYSLPLPISYFIIFFFTFYFLFGFLLRQRKLPMPPGPRQLPIIGNMLLMDKLTHRGLAELGKQYGGLVHLRLGVLHNVAVTTPDMARQVLQVHDNAFSNRPATIAVQYLTYYRADMAFAHYGPFWRQMRKLCVMKLFSRKRAESWASVRDEVDAMISAVNDSSGKPVNVGELVFGLTRNITYRAAFGSNSHEGQDDFVTILQEFSKLMGAFNIADFIPPWLRWIDPQGFKKRLARARASLDRFIDKIIDEHVATRKEGRTEEEDSDMVDDLLAFLDDGQAADGYSDDLQASLKLTRDNIKAMIMDVMFGGTETVASAIEWAMAELMKSPEELVKVQAELAEVVGLERRVHESDLDKLPYLKCTVKETLRLHPPIPLLLHETAEDSEVNGYLVPAGCRVSINAWAIGRDPSAWDEPETFKPSRFAKEGAVDFKGKHFEFIPFGSGRRSCPGMQLGLYAMELAVAHLCHCFNWDLPDGMKAVDLDMSDVFGLTAPRANSLIAVPAPRLHSPIS
ncbi:cytochrome P450 84A1-like [Aristolochia californica]|uniref:cytochrome P450 84A1-like n=1 Tax=Aristolochia californica TaxID=171875 RepID=UPI0035DF6F51